ncbi:MAG TPA: biosynthetic-type acetolactate synthase large subunit [Candidatus Binatia bacterium]|jgi:acetolactate synthase-1/2/3 large subunit|nr:biosynthetic-type acetolactate synthase large subunit [Candidatus Binatia bacterium]
MRMTGAEALLRALEREGTDVLFGLPGGAILPTYDPLIGSAMRHVLMRHEQGAGHAAEGYAHVTGRPGVCMATSGPGGTNLVTPLTDAMMDSVPLVAVTGQVARADMGRQAFQEAPITDIVRPVTKQTWLVMDPDEIPQAVHDAFRVAREGRPGPVLIDVPKDVQRADLEWYDPRPPAREPSAPPDPNAVAEAARLLREARRPVLYVGGGVLRAGACGEVLELALKQQLPVTTTLMARGAFPDSHPLALGMPGMHGSYAAVTAMQRADLLVAVGARFDDRVTGRLDGFAPEARVVHVDVDPREIGKNRAAEVGVVGDARDVLKALLEAVPGFDGVDDPDGRRSWLATLDGWKEQHPYTYRQQPDGALKPQLVVERLREATGGRAVLTAGVGQHQMWASQFWTFDRPLAWANSGGLGTMGFALPAALGAKAARPDELVIAVDGDGSFQMTVQELASSVAEDLPVLVAIVNNGVLGMVKQWQELFFSGHSHIHLRDDLPDFARLAESYGCVGLRASRAEDVDEVVSWALEAVRERTVVVDFRVDPAEMVFPMVPAGATNDGILLEPPGVPA